MLEPYELLLKLTLAAGSESTSRAAQQGLLYVPDELGFEPVNPSDDEDPEADPFMERIEQAFTRAIHGPEVTTRELAVRFGVHDSQLSRVRRKVETTARSPLADELARTGDRLDLLHDRIRRLARRLEI